MLEAKLVTPSLLQQNDLTMLRIRRGAYGSELIDGRHLQTGGLEQEMLRMDSALAQNYPITIHVAHHSDTLRESYLKVEANWKGKIVVHPMNLLTRDAREIRGNILSLVGEVRPTFVHIHHPWDSIDLEIIRDIPKSTPLIASDHTTSVGSASPSSLPPQQRIRSLWLKALDHYKSERGVGLRPILAAISTGNRIADFLGRKQVAQKCRQEVVARANDCPYAAFALTAVSLAGKGDFGSLCSCIIPPPVDSDFFNRQNASTERANQILKELGISQEAKLITYHARMCKEKGQQILPLVAQRLRDQGYSKFAFLLVGPESQSGMMAALKQDIHTKGLEKYVYLLSGVDQVTIRDLLAVSSMSVFPTFDEGLGLTAVEALMMEIPVVAHKVGGVSEVVTDHVNGRLVKAGDIDAFANAVSDLLNDPKMRADYGRIGREMLKDRFAPEACAQRYLEQVCLPLVFAAAES